MKIKTALLSIALALGVGATVHAQNATLPPAITAQIEAAQSAVDDDAYAAAIQAIADANPAQAVAIARAAVQARPSAAAAVVRAVVTTHQSQAAAIVQAATSANPRAAAAIRAAGTQAAPQAAAAIRAASTRAVNTAAVLNTPPSQVVDTTVTSPHE